MSLSPLGLTPTNVNFILGALEKMRFGSSSSEVWSNLTVCALLPPPSLSAQVSCVAFLSLHQHVE